MQHIGRKIQIIACKGAAHIVFFLMTAFRKLLEFRNDPVIAALFSAAERTHPVVHLTPPVKTQHDVVHLAVAELHDLVVQEHAVCSKRKAEVFIVQFFLFPPVGDQFLHDFPVHRRLSAEEIHFQISSVSGIPDQEIKRGFPGFRRHQSPAAVVFTLFRKTVPAGQIAVVCDMQAHGLHDTRSGGKYFNSRFIGFLGK